MPVWLEIRFPESWKTVREDTPLMTRHIPLRDSAQSTGCPVHGSVPGISVLAHTVGVPASATRAGGMASPAGELCSV